MDAQPSLIDPSVSQSPSPEEQWRDEQKRHWERQIRIGKWMNGITLGGMIVAGIALFFVWHQAGSARIAADAARDQAISSKTATDIAKQGFDESVKTFRSEQRAWVLPKDTRIRKSEDTWHLEFQVSNSGKVPASIIGAHFVISSIRLPQCPIGEERLPPFGMPLAPNGENWIGLGLKGKTLEWVKASHEVYLYGKINYTDTFPGTKTSTFCSIFRPKLGTTHEVCPFCNTYN